MVAALRFGFDNQGSALGGDLGTKARPGDSAAYDHDIELAHLECRLRI